MDRRWVETKKKHNKVHEVYRHCSAWTHEIYWNPQGIFRVNKKRFDLKRSVSKKHWNIEWFCGGLHMCLQCTDKKACK